MRIPNNIAAILAMMTGDEDLKDEVQDFCEEVNLAVGNTDTVKKVRLTDA